MKSSLVIGLKEVTWSISRPLIGREHCSCCFPIPRGVEGFVIYGWDLSNLGYSPYMTNLGDKSHMMIIRDVFHDGTWVYRAHIRQNPVTNTVQFELSHLGGICHIWGGVSYMGGVCQIWVPIYPGTVMKYVANMTLYPYMTNPTPYDKYHPDMTNPTHIWEILLCIFL